MILKNAADFYETDQSIPVGTNVITWRETFTPDQFFVCTYQRYQGGGHWAGGVFWKHACPISDVVEIVNGVPDVKEEVTSYGDAWLKAYAAAPANNETVADDALVAYKTREANGDFKK